MPIGFNPYALPNVPSLPGVPLPKVDPMAGLTALLAVQKAIAQQQALAARAAGGGGTRGVSGKTDILELPDGTGNVRPIEVTAPSEGERKEKKKEIRRQNLYTIAQNDKELQQSLAKMKNLSVAGQKEELNKIRRQHIPRIAELGGAPEYADSLLRDITSSLKEDIDRQQKAVNDTGVLQSAWDSLRMGWSTLRDSIRSIGATPAQEVAMGRARAREREQILEQNPHLRDKTLQRREGRDSSFMDNPVLNTVEGLGESLGEIGAVAAGQAGGAGLMRAGGALLSMIPTPATQLAGRALQGTGWALGGMAAGGAATGAITGTTPLVDRLIEANPDATDAQLAQMVERGKGTAMAANALVNAIPFGLAQTGVPMLSRTAATVFGRNAIKKTATAEAEKALTATAAKGVTKEAIQAAAKATGQNAVYDAMAQQGARPFWSRYLTSMPMTAMDLGLMGAANVTGQNIAYNQATGGNVPWTKGAGDAFISGMTMAPFFGLLNAHRTPAPNFRAYAEPVPRKPEPAAQTTGSTAGAPKSAPSAAKNLADFIDNAKQLGPKQRADFLNQLRDGQIKSEDVRTLLGMYENAPEKTAKDQRIAKSLQTWLEHYDNMRAADQLATEVGIPITPARAGDAEVIKQTTDRISTAAKNYTTPQLETDIFFTLKSGGIQPADMVKVIKQSSLAPDQKKVARRAVDIYNAYTKDTGAAKGATDTTGGTGEPASAVARTGQEGEGRADTANPASGSAKPADTEAPVADIANELSARTAGNNQANEGGGNAGVPAPDTGTPEANEGAVAGEAARNEQAANGKPGSTSPAEQSAQPDIRQRGAEPAAGTGNGRDGVAEAPGGNESNIIETGQRRLTIDEIQADAARDDAEAEAFMKGARTAEEVENMAGAKTAEENSRKLGLDTTVEGLEKTTTQEAIDKTTNPLNRDC